MRTTNSSYNKRGQVSTIDFIIGFIIIIVALILSAQLIMTSKETSNFDDVRRQAISASQILISEGSPTNWTSTNIVRPGILTDKKLNITKLNELISMSYQDQRFRIAGNYQYYAYFKNRTSIMNITGCGFGSPEIIVDANCEPTITTNNNLVTIQRMLAYNDSIIIMVVMVWD